MKARRRTPVFIKSVRTCCIAANSSELVWRAPHSALIQEDRGSGCLDKGSWAHSVASVQHGGGWKVLCLMLGFILFTGVLMLFLLPPPGEVTDRPVSSGPFCACCVVRPG